MVRLGVRPVGGKIRGDRINAAAQVRFDFINPYLKPINLVAEHLLPFNDQVQFVPKILGHDADMMFEHVFYFFEIFCVHNIPLLPMLVREIVGPGPIQGVFK